jgi:hypothetical protein
MKKFILFLGLINYLFIFCLISNAQEKTPKLYFDSRGKETQYKEVVFENGVTIQFIKPLLGSYDTTLIGVRLHIQNNATAKIVLSWRDSLIECEKISTMPFIQGMWRGHIGDKVATPEILIYPGRIVVQDIYFSNKEHLFFVDKHRILGLDLFDDVDAAARRDYIDPIRLILKFRDEQNGEVFYEAESFRMRATV